MQILKRRTDLSNQKLVDSAKHSWIARWYLAPCFVLLLGSAQVSPAQNTRDLRFEPHQLSETNFHGLLIGAAALLARRGEPTNTVLVDVRSQDAFRLAHIPGSLNIPLFTIKTKTFLRSKRLVLLNEGHSTRSLLAAAARLQQDHFDSIAILDGGIRAWQLAGGSLEGERPEISAWATISPLQFYSARPEPGWLVIELTGDGVHQSESPKLTSVKVRLDKSTLLDDLTRIVTQHSGTKRVLLVTTTGERYDEMQIALDRFQPLPVFYLAGGRQAYERFFADLLAREQQRSVTVSSQEQTTSRLKNAVRVSGSAGRCCGN